MTELQFDLALARGWRFLGGVMVRHSISIFHDNPVLTIPGRIVLADFRFSDSQKKQLRRGKKTFRIEICPKNFIESDFKLFEEHIKRFTENAPISLARMINTPQGVPHAASALRIFADGEHIATSWTHHSPTSADASYCVYSQDVKWAKYSLGTLTMLLEIELVLQRKCTYYYVGYRYNVPSPFDYKANFYGLEILHKFEKWIPCARIPISKSKEH
jgi:leucyl-tRNA---protein transferase